MEDTTDPADVEDVNPFFEVEQLEIGENHCESSNARIKCLLEENSQLHEKNLHLDKQNIALKRNISCLYKTARLEMQKCEEKIASLQNELSCFTGRAPSVDVYTQTDSSCDKRRNISCEKLPIGEKYKRQDTTVKQSSCYRTPLTKDRKNFLTNSKNTTNSNRKKRRSTSEECTNRSKKPRKEKIVMKSKKQSFTKQCHDLEEGEIISSSDDNC